MGAALAQGTLVGGYRIVRRLGEGGMGAVYCAEHVLLGRAAAIKVLRPEVSQNEDVVRRFFNEARATSRITDPGIVQLFDFGYHEDGSAYIVMELLEGEPLDQRVAARGRLDVLEAVRIVRLTCASLATAHAAGIIHRDLKPANVFLVADPAVPGGERVKILDFGIAKLNDGDPSRPLTREDVVMGTPAFMSPEQFRNASESDARSDIYSLGCVLFHLLAGRDVFQVRTIPELIAAHVLSPPPSLLELRADLPPQLDEIVQCCLAKSPADRFARMADFGAALEQVEGELTGTRVPRRTPPPGSLHGRAVANAATILDTPAAGRRRWVGVLAGALGALVLAAVVVSVTSGREQSGTIGTRTEAGGGVVLDAGLLTRAPDAVTVAVDATIAPDAAPDAAPAAAADAAAADAGVLVDAGLPLRPAHPIRPPPGPSHHAPGHLPDGPIDRGD